MWIDFIKESSMISTCDLWFDGSKSFSFLVIIFISFISLHNSKLVSSLMSHSHSNTNSNLHGKSNYSDSPVDLYYIHKQWLFLLECLSSFSQAQLQPTNRKALLHITCVFLNFKSECFNQWQSNCWKYVCMFYVLISF